MAQQAKKDNGQVKAREVLDVKKIKNPQEVLEENVEALAVVGGYELLEMAIDGVQNLNPERKARKKIFLTEANKKGERDALKRNLEIWAGILTEGGSIVDMVEDCGKKSEEAEKLLKENLKKAVDETV